LDVRIPGGFLPLLREVEERAGERRSVEKDCLKAPLKLARSTNPSLLALSPLVPRGEREKSGVPAWVL
jgi:hypothetical protein